jgi:hypothetical protein
MRGSGYVSMVVALVRQGIARGQHPMLELTSFPLHLLLLLVASLLLLALVRLTRPRRRRLFAALLGGLAFGVLNVGWDLVAAAAGWWRYPSVATPYAPPGFYAVAALVWGAGMDLVGWRVARHRGLVVLMLFLVALTLLGVLRDHVQANATQVLVFGPGVTPTVADALGYASCLAVAEVVMRAVAGSAGADALATSRSQPWEDTATR